MRQLLVAVLGMTGLLLTSCGDTQPSSMADVPDPPARSRGYADPEIEQWLAAQRPEPDTPCMVPVRAPGLVNLISSTRPEGLESLDFYQGLLAYGEEDRAELVNRFVVAEDCPAEIELTSIPYGKASRRSQEASLYFGESHELSVYWLIQEQRSAYEYGKTTRQEAERKIGEAASQVTGASNHFETYLEIRQDQWRQDDSSSPLPYAIDGRLALAAKSDDLWANRSLVAFADEVRFLDRHGLVRLARITATQLRQRANPELARLMVTSSLIQSFFCELDMDWALTLSFRDEASLYAKKLESYDFARAIDLERTHRLACIRNLVPYYGQPKEGLDMAMILLGCNPELRAKLLVGLFEEKNQYALTENLRLVSLALDPPTALILSQNLDFIDKLLKSARDRDLNDWVVQCAIQNLVRFFHTELPTEFIGQLSESWRLSLPISIDRFRRLVACTSHDRLLNVNMMISRTLAFSLSIGDVDSKEKLRSLYLQYLDFRELESRTLRQAIARARRDQPGLDRLQRMLQLTNAFSTHFWNQTISSHADFDRLFALLVLESSRTEETLLQDYGSVLSFQSSCGWIDDLEQSTVVIHFAQWIDFSSPRPAPKLGAFLVFSDEKGNLTVRFLKMDLTISSDSVSELKSQRRRGLKDAQRSHEAHDQSFIESVSSLADVIQHHHSEVVLILESSTGMLPWTQVLTTCLGKSKKRPKSISICFHPNQLVRKRQDNPPIQSVDFVTNFDYRVFRKRYPDFPFEVPDLKEVEREGQLTRAACEPLGVSWQTHATVFPLRDYDEGSVIHFAGHATSMDLRMVMGMGETEVPHIQRLQREMKVWCRTPYVASTLVLAPFGESNSPEPVSPFLTAASVRFLPIHPPDTVVLSTCNSVGGHSLPSKAPAGLAKAFWIWGVDSVIASSDSIPDDNPARFLPQFYEASLKGKPLPEAFYHAYRESFQEKGEFAAGVNWNFYGL